MVKYGGGNAADVGLVLPIIGGKAAGTHRCQFPCQVGQGYDRALRATAQRDAHKGPPFGTLQPRQQRFAGGSGVQERGAPHLGVNAHSTIGAFLEDVNATIASAQRQVSGLARPTDEGAHFGLGDGVQVQVAQHPPRQRYQLRGDRPLAGPAILVGISLQSENLKETMDICLVKVQLPGQFSDTQATLRAGGQGLEDVEPGLERPATPLQFGDLTGTGPGLSRLSAHHWQDPCPLPGAMQPK